MPNVEATVDSTKTFELKSAPPDGYVTLRRMTFGEFMSRRQMVSSMKISGGKGNDFEGQMDLANQAVTEFEFAKCIVDHNLTRSDGKPFDFSRPVDIKKLDPKVGQEIGNYIDSMNQLEDEDENGDGEALKVESEQLSLEANQTTQM